MKLSTAYLTIASSFLFPHAATADWGLPLMIPMEEPEVPSLVFDPFDTRAGSLFSMLQQHQRAMEDSLFFRSAVAPPSFGSVSMTNDATYYEVSIHLPSGLSPEDLHVDFDERDRSLTISGQHEFTDAATNYRSVSQFSRSFTLDSTIEAEKLQASIENGGSVLVVTAPKNQEKMEHLVRSIPVMQKTPQAVVEDVPLRKEESADSAAEEEESSPEEEENESDSFDPFHVKEAVQKAINFLPKQNEREKNPNERLEGYKASELL